VRIGSDTVSAACPCLPPILAVIVAAPAVIPVALPALSTPTICPALDVHVALAVTSA
jgi:hypothetical protein